MSPCIFSHAPERTPVNRASLVLLGLIFSLLLAGCVATANPESGSAPPDGYDPVATVDLSTRSHDGETLGQFSLEETTAVTIFLALRDIDTRYFDLRLQGSAGERFGILHGEDYRTDANGGGTWERSLPQGDYWLVLTAIQSPGVMDVYWKHSGRNILPATSAPAVPPTVGPMEAAAPNRESSIRSGEYGVTFRFDPYLAAGAEARLVAAATDESGMSHLQLPAHLAFTFVDSYADGEPLLQRQQLSLQTMPQLVVYPAADYAARHPQAKAQIEQLQALLATRPNAPDGPLPYLPLVNAAQVLQSQLTYLDFDNGSGVRYLTAFSQGLAPVTNQDLLFTFQGLTDDGQYYVAAFFPLLSAALPNSAQVDDWESSSLDYPTYVEEVKETLDNLTPLDFTPHLDLLDALMSSLRVEPDLR